MQKLDMVGKSAGQYDLKTWGLWGRMSAREEVKGFILQCFVKKKGRVGVHNSKESYKYNLYA